MADVVAKILLECKFTVKNNKKLFLMLIYDSTEVLKSVLYFYNTIKDR